MCTCDDREPVEQSPRALPVYSGVIRVGKVEFDHPVVWPDGVRVSVQAAAGHNRVEHPGHAIIVGFGPTGRWVADLLGRFSVPYCIVERNIKTVGDQQSLGKRIVLGDATEELVLEMAGVREARILALTIPDEKAAVRVIRCAKALNPKMVIFVKTEHTSTALVARKAGADVVISAEIAVAKEFHELLLLCLTGSLSAASDGQ
jgi:voltage-gated potassium channel Kch